MKNGIPVVKARFGGFGQTMDEIRRRNRLTVAVEQLENDRETLGRQVVGVRAAELMAELQGSPRWDDDRSRTGTFFRNLWGEEDHLHYYKYTDLTARLRELQFWASGRSYDETTARLSSPHGQLVETIRQSPEPVAERVGQIVKEDVVPAAQRLSDRLEQDKIFRKRFLIVLGVLALFIIIKRL